MEKCKNIFIRFRFRAFDYIFVLYIDMSTHCGCFDFLCLLTHALTTGNVRNTVEILILTPCVFYTEYSFLDIPIILYLCNVQLMNRV